MQTGPTYIGIKIVTVTVSTVLNPSHAKRQDGIYLFQIIFTLYIFISWFTSAKTKTKAIAILL